MSVNAQETAKEWGDPLAATGMLGELERLYGADGWHWSCLGYDGEAKLRRLVEAAASTMERWGGPNNVLNIIEIGAHRGASACILADYGQVTTYDIEDDPLFDKVVAHFTKGPRVTRHILGNGRGSETERAQAGNVFLGERLPSMQFDLAFIDGNHQYESVRANFEAVRHCGRVIFHDYEHSRHKDRTVRFVDAITDGRVTKLSPFAMWEAFSL